MGGKAYGKATGLYNKHRKYSEQWNPWHPFYSTHDFPPAPSFSQQTTRWIDQHVRVESVSSGSGIPASGPGLDQLICSVWL